MKNSPTRTEIVTARSAPEPGSVWPMSPLDRVNLWLVLRGTWLFDEHPDALHLKDSLSTLLAHYPQLAGRMRGARELRLTNQGLPFTEVERLDLSLADIDARPSLADRLSNPMNKGRVKRGDEAPMSVRLTRLRDGAALGVRCSHGCLDGTAFYTMIRRWSACCTGQPIGATLLDTSFLPRVPGRSKREVRREALEAGWRRPSLLRLLGALPNLLPGRLLQRSPPIHLPAELLLRLRQEARERSGCPDLSTHEALSARIASFAPALHGLPEGTPCQQALVADMRGRLQGCSPDFVGNAAWVLPGASYPAGADLGRIAALAHDSLAPLLARPSPRLREQLSLGLETLEHGLLLLPYDVAGMHARRPTLSYINSFVRLPIYEIDLGTAARPILPIRAIPHNLPDPFLFWPAPPSRGGVELFLTGVAARALSRDPDLLRRFSEPISDKERA